MVILSGLKGRWVHVIDIENNDGDKTMKEKIHPEYKAATITCACGNIIETRSTIQSIHLEICSNCHPFYTGKQKFMDSAGRVEKFRRKYGLEN
jgi:large subunit ribosomal protein L31